MRFKKLFWFAMLFALNSTLFADSSVFTVSDSSGDDTSSIGNNIQPGDLDLVSLSAKSGSDDTIFKATFARPIKTPDSRVISQSGATLESFAPNGFYAFNLDVYIDTDGIQGSGKTNSLPGRNAQIDAEFAWEKVICLNPRPHYARLALVEEMKRLALNEVITRKGSYNSEDAKEVERRVKFEIEEHIYFPTLIWVHGSTVQFSVPDSFLQGKAEREWSYAAGVMHSAVGEHISMAGARSLTTQKAEYSDVLQLPSFIVQENMLIQKKEPAYVDLILPIKKVEGGKQ